MSYYEVVSQLSMQSVIQFREQLLMFELNSQLNYTPSFGASEAPCLIAWDCLGLGPRYSICFPFTEPGLCMNTRVQRLNRQLEDREEQFTQFYKMCM